MDFRLIAIFARKPHKTLIFSLVLLTQFLLHHQNALLHHRMNQRHHLLETDDFADLANGDFRLDLQGLHYHVLEIVKRHGIKDIIG